MRFAPSQIRCHDSFKRTIPTLFDTRRKIVADGQGLTRSASRWLTPCGDKLADGASSRSDLSPRPTTGAVERIPYSVGVPNGCRPLARTVFGISPEPQRMNDPKSFYQSPAGPCGAVFTQSCRRRRSARETCRSATRSSRCSQTGRGRSANRIFGNCVSSEDGPDQILARVVLSGRVGFRDKSLVSDFQAFASSRFGLDAFLGERDQRPADRKMSLFRDAPNLRCEWAGDGDALPHR